MHQRLGDRLQQILYDRFRTISVEKDKVAAAEEYLRQLPTGPHAYECESYLSEVRYRKRLTQNKEALQALETEWPPDSVDLANIESLKNKVEAFTWPHPDAVNDELTNSLETLREQIRTCFREQKTIALRERVNDLLNQQRFSDVFKELAALTAESPGQEWRALTQEVLERMPGDLALSIHELIERRKFSEVCARIKSTLESAKSFEKFLAKANESKLLKTVLESQQKISALLEDATEQWDECLYRDVRRLRSEEACRAYLNEAPLKVMAGQVKAYLEYLEKLKQPLKLQVKVSIWWDPSYQPDQMSTGENHVRVYRDGTLLFTAGPIREIPGGTTDVGLFVLKVKDSYASANFLVQILETDTRSDDEGGRGERSVALKELLKTVEIPLRGQNFENKAFLQMYHGWPVEPELPAWSR